ncbi:hypothetical protein P4575_26320 [Priestia megaterium]|uniref:hypothetical protein n=1 Tax=Priestia megaterium TaxID=1404 RepID=UPI002E248A10|nr:hypothetical protein [Priestia megaterium]
MAEKPKEKVINIKDRKGNDVKTVTLNEDESYFVHNGQVYTLKDFLFAGEVLSVTNEGERIPVPEGNIEARRGFISSNLSPDEENSLATALKLRAEQRLLGEYNYFRPQQPPKLN